MSKKRVLLIGDGNHQFLINYVLWLRKQRDIELQVDILSFTALKEANRKYYNSCFGIEKDLVAKLIYKVKGVRRYFRFYQYKMLFRSLPRYDIVHFHFIRVDSYFFIRQFKKYTTSKIILTIWGSDMYRIKPGNQKAFVESCRYADYITFTNRQSLYFFREKYDWQKSNLKVCRFGLAPLENLKSMNATKEAYKEQLNWEAKKIAVTIGYNLSKAQRHLEILRQFGLSEILSLKDEIQLVLPVTYGGEPGYKKQLEERLGQLPFEYFVYYAFLSDEEISYIRKASDIMIQLQDTDQFSGSMQEHLFARNVVITGSWLPYETMKEHGAWFIEIAKMNDLGTVLFDVIRNYKRYYMQTKNNPQVILELSSWEKNIGDWILLYKTCGSV